MEVNNILLQLGIQKLVQEPGDVHCRSPIDGEHLCSIRSNTSNSQLHEALDNAKLAFETWRQIPAPRRGELVRVFGSEVRAKKRLLAELICIETGKTLSEAEGEVQEVIDICDFAVGLSRQLHGLTIASERPLHRMMEQWHPLGVVGVISAFNFPFAVWAWNSALALVCGNSILWKPSEKTVLIALAANQLLSSAAEKIGYAVPLFLSQVLIGGADAAVRLAKDERVSLLSATGSTSMGQALAPLVAARLGRSLLELGGNNAIVVTPEADLDLAVQGIAFGAWGTSGQRCTTTRRLIAHVDIIDPLLQRLERIREKIIVGDPRDDSTLMGPLINESAYKAMQHALNIARSEGGVVRGGERVQIGGWMNAWYTKPALVLSQRQTEIVKTETFAPILYAIPYKTLDEAIELNNQVSQGLSSSIFTKNIIEAERFLSATGSDCGIANVNIGTSGAEIGGAFGGEKQTGGGRESGSDAWKSYMRRATNTINYSTHIPLAQNVKFDV